MRNKRAFGWFLFGLGTQLQIIASLSFTELFVILAAPLLFLKEIAYMRRNGIMPFFNISIALVCGCVVACLVNHTQPVFVLRGMAVCCLIPCSIVVTHWMLRTDMTGLKWSFVGGALSGVLSTFVFQKSVEVSMLAGGVAGSDSAKAIMGGATYWIHRLGAFLSIPSKGWYLQCPLTYSVLAPVFMAGFSMLTSVSGRGASLRAIGGAALVLIGGKKMSTIHNRLCKNFWLVVLVGVLVAFAVKQGYQIAATNGWLGEKALMKYERQTKGKTGIMALLMGGRMEAFCGLIACVDKPIVGFGPWAQDYNGYKAEFLAKYGDQEDYDDYIKSVAYADRHGLISVNLIPCHSVVTEFWLWYGICGLVFCLYVFFVMLRYLKQDCWAVPQWFFWLAASIPGMFWDMCFNPLGSRVTIPMFVVACLLVRAVRMGRFKLSWDMQREALSR